MSQLKINGFEFAVATPYAAGHTLNENEASTLNQTYAENVRNNVAGKIKAAVAAAEKAGTEFNIDGAGSTEGVTLRQELQAYADAYVFGQRTARGSTKEPADPVEREAHRIARDAIGTALKAKGQKVKDLPEGKMDEMVALHAKSDKVVAEAKRRVKEREKIGAESIDLDALGLGDTTQSEATTSEA